MGSEFDGYFTDAELARACCREAFSRGSMTGFSLAIRQPRASSFTCCVMPLSTASGRGVIAYDVSQQKQQEEGLGRLHADMAFPSEELKQRESEIRQLREALHENPIRGIQ